MRPGLRGLRGARALAESVASVRRFEVQRVPEDFGSKGVVPDPPTTTMVEGVVAMVLRIGRRHPMHQTPLSSKSAANVGCVQEEKECSGHGPGRCKSTTVAKCYLRRLGGRGVLRKSPLA